MNVTVNGRSREVAVGTTLHVLVSTETGGGRGGAAALDGDVVPRSLWPDTALRDGSVIEIVTAVQGG
ncbi:sulfur carrier protein ThiS [Nakamurella sp.]|uniref:sulfur carrier protein ThiS n=1 Tax=Nakamurella sp. TaxID=1869182 RepID=UPI0037845DBE